MIDWASISQGISIGLAGIGVYFIYDLIRDFKSFKKEVGVDITTLKQERKDFENIVESSSLQISARVMDVQKIHNDFSHSMNGMMKDFERELLDLSNLSRESARDNKMMIVKMVDVSKILHSRLSKVEEDMKTVKLQIKDITIFKTKK